MSDERFDHDLQHLLREIAGGEAPMSLRYRLADLVDRVPPGHRLWITPPLRLSMVLVAAAAVVAMAILFLPAEPVGPSPSASPQPTRSAEPSDGLAPNPSPSQGPEQSQEPTLAPTPRPTPSGDWSGLDWSEPVPHDPGQAIQDVVPWGDGYVAIAGVWTEGGTAAEFLTSGDGIRWTVEKRIDDVGFHVPRFLVAFNGGLLAITSQTNVDNPAVSYGPPLVWQSDDGRAWSLAESGDLGEVLDGASIAHVAAGNGSLVIVTQRYEEQADGEPLSVVGILRSTDGRDWDRSQLPVDAVSPAAASLVVYRDLYVLVGQVDSHPTSGAGSPAAWYSRDGLVWTEATLDGEARVGFGFGTLMAADRGLLVRAVRYNYGTGPIDGSWWQSSDGRRWLEIGDLAVDFGRTGWYGADGTRMIVLAPDAGYVPESGAPFTGLTRAWTSRDGLAWSELTVSGAMTETAGIGWWVVPDGVVYAAQEADWFAEATFGP